MKNPYQICTRCVMDTSDPDIRFDDQGVCNHCYNYSMTNKRDVICGEAGLQALDSIIHKMKRDGADKAYDCVIGLSGGMDSSYVAYKVKQLGLRPLAVHLDNGWNSELAVQNIEHICRRLNIDLHTVVLNWEEFRELQKAFLRASTPDSEIPTDHAIMATLLQTADSIGVRYIVTGMNPRTETHLPHAWSQGHFDWQYIKEVNKQFGSTPIKTFPHLSLKDYYSFSWRTRFVSILNYLDSSTAETSAILEQELGWRHYGGKHYESIYTRWFQGYWLPHKFGFDKRRCHLSSLICSGELSRESALAMLDAPTYDRTLQEQDTAYVCKKLNLSKDDLDEIFNLSRHTYREYSPISWFYREFTYQVPRLIYRFFNDSQ